jgi:sulfate/thiosulfate transport system permease protein
MNAALRDDDVPAFAGPAPQAAAQAAHAVHQTRQAKQSLQPGEL